MNKDNEQVLITEYYKKETDDKCTWVDISDYVSLEQENAKMRELLSEMNIWVIRNRMYLYSEVKSWQNKYNELIGKEQE